MKAPSYFDHNSRATNDTPLDVIDWRDPPLDDSYEVEVRELDADEWRAFKALLEGLK